MSFTVIFFLALNSEDLPCFSKHLDQDSEGVLEKAESNLVRSLPRFKTRWNGTAYWLDATLHFFANVFKLCWRTISFYSFFCIQTNTDEAVSLNW